MSILGVSGVPSAIPATTREQLAAIVAARPAALQMQTAAASTLDRGSTGEGTPAIDASGGVDLYA
jgi:hypothetical protein